MYNIYNLYIDFTGKLAVVKKPVFQAKEVYKLVFMWDQETTCYCVTRPRQRSRPEFPKQAERSIVSVLLFETHLNVLVYIYSKRSLRLYIYIRTEVYCFGSKIVGFTINIIRY